MFGLFAHLQWRIAAGYVGLIALVLLALGVYLVSFLRAQQLAALEAQLERQARLVAGEAQQHLWPEAAAGLDPLAKRQGRESGLRITLIALDGTVLGDSDRDPAVMDNHSARPEVQQALQTGSGQSRRHSATLDQDLLYVAVPIERAGTVIGVARVALPVHEVEATVNRVGLAVASALAAAALLSIALAIVLARVTTGRLQAFTRAAQRLAGGDLDQSIPVVGRDEVSLLARAFNEMAATLRRHIRAVEDERERLAVVVSHLADGLIITDRDGTVRLLNPAAGRLLGVAPARAEGRSLIAVVRDHELAEVVGDVLAGASVPGPGQPRLIELTGRRRVVQAMASRIPSADGSGQRALLILQDVTEARRTETMRREFVANVSHELRTPVAALKALVETLEAGALEEPEVAHDFLGRMHVEVDGLAQLVEELLELSRIESRQLALRVQPVDLGRVVMTAVERLRPLAERQGLKLELETPGDLPLVEADPERIQQVVVNLVHNAVKFTPLGGRVVVGTERRDGEVAVTVTDTGMGIAAETLQRLFERFYKADRARAGGGTGLGLAIAKHLVQAHGGRIWAESSGEGQGATFTFVLPVAPTSTSP